MSTFHLHFLSPAPAVVLAALVCGAAWGVDNQATSGTVTPGIVIPGKVTAGTVSATVDGREIRAVASEPVTINTAGGQATVNIGSHLLVVGKDKLQLDEGMPSSLPPATKVVEISVAEEMLIVKADGKEVLRAKMDEKKQTDQEGAKSRSGGAESGRGF